MYWRLQKSGGALHRHFFAIIMLPREKKIAASHRVRISDSLAVLTVSRLAIFNRRPFVYPLFKLRIYCNNLETEVNICAVMIVAALFSVDSPKAATNADLSALTKGIVQA